MKNLSMIVLVAGVLSLASACGKDDSNSKTADAGQTTADSAPVAAPDQPQVIHHGSGRWAHWNHPDFNRPTYAWHSDRVKSVTCVASDSHNRSYPVVEIGYHGVEYKDVINRTQDLALDRCYAQSGGDNRCRFHECTPGY